jgi:hypothetical protein
MITSPLPGVYVVDFGQNMAGQSEITVEDVSLAHAP